VSEQTSDAAAAVRAAAVGAAAAQVGIVMGSVVFWAVEVEKWLVRKGGAAGRPRVGGS
jgi:hypothetical protein